MLKYFFQPTQITPIYNKFIFWNGEISETKHI